MPSAPAWRRTPPASAPRLPSAPVASTPPSFCSAVRWLAGLDPGLIGRLGLVVGWIGARDRFALANADGDELLQPLLLEGIARHLVGKMARHDDGAVLVGHDHVAG